MNWFYGILSLFFGKLMPISGTVKRLLMGHHRSLPLTKSAFLAMVLMLGMSDLAWGQTTKTASTGNWGTAATWSPSGVPAANDPVVIPQGVTLTVDISNASCASVAINSTSASNGTATLQFNSGSVLSVSGNITLGTTGTKTGSLVMSNGGTLKLGGAFNATNIGTLTIGTGTFEYNGAAQTIYATAYNNLTFSGSGAKSITTGTAVGRLLSITGTATASIGAGLNIAVDSLSLGGNGTVNVTWGSTTATTITMTAATWHQRRHRHGRRSGFPDHPRTGDARAGGPGRAGDASAPRAQMSSPVSD